MIKVFKWCIVTSDDLTAINNRLDGIEKKNRQATQEQAGRLTDFAGKFDNAMDFIGRNLPLKRKRKAFFGIVKR